MSTNNVDLEKMQSAVTRSIHVHWRLFLTEGIVLLILGILAIVVPPIATVAVAVLIGWLLLMSGVVGMIATFRTRGSPGFGWSLISAVLGIVAGVVLLGWPQSGALSLTLILTVFLVLEGVVSILYALEHKRELSGRWGMMLFSGIIDLTLAGIIFAGLPGTAAWAIGLLVGVNLLFGGSALISMALHARNAAPTSSKSA
ncbi:MAG: HdeD family acid-resistance protein [Gammaproteobacteria bacterium]